MTDQPDDDIEPTPDFWISAAPDDTPAPQLEEPVPFMVGHGRRWRRPDVAGIGEIPVDRDELGLEPIARRIAALGKDDAA